ncbi:MAG: transcriptional regulator NrdR [Thermodesulfovibrionales bacterium]|nr:transcriptional regulator NrdR [Thermodesulfovibrionales bacterium]
MKCPYCGAVTDKVIDSRSSKEGDVIRRRRECLNCKERFTSYERVEELYPLVIKKDGRREHYDRHKIMSGLQKACEKRPVPIQKLEIITREIEKKMINLGDKEINSSWIGEEVMRSLRELDKVAYVRFASVYRQFKDINEFMEEVKGLFELQGKKKR